MVPRCWRAAFLTTVNFSSLSTFRLFLRLICSINHFIAVESASRRYHELTTYVCCVTSCMTDWMIEWLIEKLLSLHVTGTLPLRDELLCRTARFITSCLNCENTAVQFVSRHGVYFGRAGSAFGLNAQLCSAQFDMPLSRLCSINTKCVWRYITLEENVYSVTARVIYHLLLVKSKRAEISVLSVDCMIDYLCVS